MEYGYINEDETVIINNEYDYSNVVPLIECVSYLVQYCDSVYRQFMVLVEEDAKRNEQLKYDYQNYDYKKSYRDSFQVYIREKSYNNITCKDFASFQSAIKDGNVKNINSLEIKLDLYYGRGKNNSLVEYENSFTVIFKPYEITFARKSNHNEANMNQIEITIKDILNKFPVTNSIFCTK